MNISVKFRDYTKRFRKANVKAVKFERICAATGLLFFVPFVSAPESRSARFCANQGFIMLLLEIVSALVCLIAGLILGLLGSIPIIGILFTIIKIALYIAVGVINLLLIAFGVFCAIKDKIVELPLIGRLRFFR